MASPTDVTLTKSRNDNKPIIDLKSLDPDADGDGKVLPSELAVHRMLVDADVDKDGFLSINEFYTAMSKFSAVQQSRQLFKKALAGVSALFLLQTFVVAILVVVVAIAFKDTYVENNGNGLPTMHNGKEDIVGTAEALVSVPLFVAPVLPTAKLAMVKSISVSYDHDDNEETPMVRAGFRIAEFRSFSPTKVVFITDTLGRQLEITGGEARLRDYTYDSDSTVDMGAGVGWTIAAGGNKKLCNADASCSAITTRGEDVQALVDEANAALVEAGYKEIPYDVANRRRLDNDECKDKDPEYTTAVAASAVSTTMYNQFEWAKFQRSLWQFCMNRGRFSFIPGCQERYKDDQIRKGEEVYLSDCDRVINTRSRELRSEAGNVEWCLSDITDENGKQVPCTERWGRMDRFRVARAAGVTDGAFFCNQNLLGICVANSFRRGCNAQAQIAAIEAAD